MIIKDLLKHVFDKDGLKMVGEFIENGGDINESVSLQGWTLLHNAVEDGNIEVITWLVKHGANINSQDNDGWTPLHLAVDADIDGAIQTNTKIDLSTTQALIKLGAIQEIANNNGETPRDIAKCYGDNTLYFYDSLIERRIQKSD